MEEIKTKEVEKKILKLKEKMEEIKTKKVEIII